MAMAESICTHTSSVGQERKPKLSPASRLLLMLLEEYCGFGSARKTHCWPSQRTLCERMGCSRRYVGKLLQRLIDGGYVASEARYRRDGSRTSNKYWLLENPVGKTPNGNAPASQARVHAFGGNRPFLQEPPAVPSNAELLQSPRKPADVSTSDSDSLSLGSSTQTKERRLAKSAVAGSSPRKCDPLTPSQATQSVQRALNSRSPNQLSSTPSNPMGQPLRTHGPNTETSVKQQGKHMGQKPNVSNETGETKRAGGGGWNGGGIPAERFESKQESIDRYGEALKRGWLDSSQASKHAFFATWAGIVRLFRSGDVTNPGGYLSALLKRRLITSFPNLDDEATVKRLRLME